LAERGGLRLKSGGGLRLARAEQLVNLARGGFDLGARRQLPARSPSSRVSLSDCS
jgi:hypothetical protein